MDDSSHANSDTLPIAPDLTEELTAYLDGELNDDEVLRVEQRLAIDTGYRKELQRLQSTWDLLGDVSEEWARDGFVKTTMEMVVDDVVRQKRNRPGAWWRWTLKVVMFAGLPLLLMASTFALMRQSQQTSIDELVSDLPAIERADRYLSINKDLDFLEKLNDSGLFSDESVLYSDEHDELVPDLFGTIDGSGNAQASPPSPLSRLDSMDAEQLNFLRNKRQRYDELSQSDRNDLQAFHQQLSQHPYAAQLLEVLNCYYDWMGTLSDTQLAKHCDLSPSDRLTDIETRLTLQARREFGRAGATRLPSADAGAVFDWYDRTSRSNTRAIRNYFVNLVRKQNMDNGRVILDQKLTQLVRRPLNQLIAVLIRVDTENFIEDLLHQNIGSLRSQLSQQARGILDGQNTDAQKQLLLKWVQAANQTRLTLGPTELQQFYDRLPAIEREELDEMAVSNRFSTLKQRYRETQLSASTENTALSDEQGTRSLIKASGLEEPELPFDETGSPNDLELPIDLKLP